MKRLFTIAAVVAALAALMAVGYRVPSVAGLAGSRPPAGSASAWEDQVAGLTPVMAERVGEALSAASDAGVELRVDSGYRSKARQKYLYERAIIKYGSAREARKWVLPPDESSHPQGKAVDVGPETGARWLERNGYRFGLCRPYENEGWHFEATTKPGRKCPARKANASAAH